MVYFEKALFMLGGTAMVVVGRLALGVRSTSNMVVLMAVMVVLEDRLSQ